MWLSSVPSVVFYATEAGRMGVGPQGTKQRDSLCVFFGSRAPFIMCKNNENGHYKLFGDTYCFGLMYGEAFELLSASEVVRFSIELLRMLAIKLLWRTPGSRGPEFSFTYSSSGLFQMYEMGDDTNQSLIRQLWAPHQTKHKEL